MTQGKFIIIDGNSLVYRAFYALPLLSTKEGIFTNAVYGFTNMLLKVLNDEQPACIALAFDKGKLTFRNEQYEDYKATRKATPDELRPQFALVKDIVRALRIPVYELEGYEADDLIGTVTLKAEEQGYESLIVTGDRDALQLVSAKTKVMLTRKGISELEIYDEAKVLERYGLKPEQVVDLKGLMGDSSDNIPGVPGVGEKTALKLLHQFGSVESLLQRLDEVKGKLKEKLEANTDQAILSKQLATIDRKVPMEIDLRECVVEDPDYKTLFQLGKQLEFKALTKLAQDKLPQDKLPQDKLPQDPYNGGLFATVGEIPEDTTLMASAQVEAKQAEYLALEPGEALERIRALSATANILDNTTSKNTAPENTGLALALELSSQDPLQAELLGFAWSTEAGQAFYSPFKGKEVLETLLEAVKTKGLKLYCHDAKKARVILDKLGFPPLEVDFDTMLGAYLVNPTLTNQALGDLAQRYLGIEREKVEDFTEICAQADFTLRLKPVLVDELARLDMLKLYYDIEHPLLYILAEMEVTGVALDTDFLKGMAVELEIQISELTRQIYDLAGEKFNINSTRQLGGILFDKLGLPVVKKTKTGYSTDVEVLETLAERHEIVALVLHYRQLVKLKSTYVDGLIGIVNCGTGKVHTTFNQTVTATGRLSSTEPNLQNIPIRLEEGRKIRKAFVPSRENWVIVSADYSQIELRILAHLSEDEKFVQAFQNDEDIHARTAAEVFGVPIEEVNREMRGHAKAVNFGIVYGISDFGLAKNIAISRKEAKTYIENYFARYAGVKRYLDDTVRLAKEAGFVTTLLNRRRYLPDLLSPNRNVRNFGERTAMNTPIQGSAADIIKLAMVRVDQCLKRQQLRARMLLQVHDELIFEAPAEEVEIVTSLVRECMESAVELKVPLKVDLKKGSNWYDMEKFND